MSHTQPGPTVRQVSAYDPDGRPVLAVLAKRTYSIGSDGRCNLADEQLPLLLDAENDPNRPNRLEHDTDLFPYKLQTDVVVKGHAHVFPARPRFDAGVEIAGAKKTVAVIGDRMCALGGGEIMFTPPAPTDRVPLRYDRAYGGTDKAALAKYGDPAEELRPYLPPNESPPADVFYSYPRNPCGTGYLFEATVESVNQLVLPNLEDPQDLLTPQRLLVGRIGAWSRMPIPHGFDWTFHGSFPRVAYIGIAPLHDPTDGPLPEALRGWAPDGLLDGRSVAEKFSFRFANGASLGLQLPYLRGDEPIRLTHIHPKHARFVVQLPGSRPKIWTDGRKGTLKETVPVIHTVVIEPDIDRVTVLWRGSAVAIRPYLPEELEKMPFRVEWA